MTNEEALKRIEELEMVVGNLILKGNGNYCIQDYDGNTIMEHDGINGKTTFE